MKYASILCLLIVSACGKSKTENCPITPQYQALTASAKEWLPYSNNKSLVFEDISSVRDTIEMPNLFAGDDEIWVGDECPVTKGQFIRVDFYDKKLKDTIRTQVGLQDQFRVFTRLNNLVFYDTKTILLDPTPYKRFELSIVLNGKTFTSVLVLECSPANNCPPAGITKVYFAKSKGLVAYERNGVLWTLS